jgi:exosortase
LFLVLLTLAFAYFITESSPEWRLMLWTLAGSAFIGSLIITQLFGGSAWTKHLWFAFFFALVSVPWPSGPEKWLTLELSMLAARVSTAVLTLGGIAAVCVGNTIEVSTGTLGVDEACSGIRSFQSSIMAGLFLGELYMLRLAPRIILCLAGLVVAYGLNIARMLILSIAVETTGTMSAIDKWHDPAGFVILIATMGILWGLCTLAATFPSLVSAAPSHSAPPASNLRPPSSGLRSPLLATASVLAAMLLTAIGTEVWFRYKEKSVLEAPGWTIAPVAEGSNVVDEPLAKGVQDLLLYDTGLQRSWVDERGRNLHLIYLRWEPSKKSAFLSTPHTPEWCQSSLGRRILSKSEERVTRIHGIPIRYQLYEIQGGADKFHLLYVPNDTRSGDELIDSYAMGGNPGDRWQRFRWALEGRRNTGNRSLQLALVGESDAATAEAQILEILPSLIQRNDD